MADRESINFKLPKPLAEALRAAAKERNTTATNLVIQGLHHVLGAVDGVETDVETRLHQIESNLEAKFEAKLEAVTIKLAQLEGAMMMLQRNQNTARQRKSAYSNYYSGQSAQLVPLKEQDLAWRFGTTAANLREKQQSLNAQDFVRWCQDRDPSKVAWQYDSKDGLYHPVK